jgi:hypothetical protein
LITTYNHIINLIRTQLDLIASNEHVAVDLLAKDGKSGATPILLLYYVIGYLIK